MGEILRENDLSTILKRKEIEQEIKKSVGAFMRNIFESHAFQQALSKYEK